MAPMCRPEACDVGMRAGWSHNGATMFFLLTGPLQFSAASAEERTLGMTKQQAQWAVELCGAF
jgi:hypothetical protein